MFERGYWNLALQSVTLLLIKSACISPFVQANKKATQRWLFTQQQD